MFHRWFISYFPTAPGHPHASAADPAPAAAPGGHAPATASADLSQLQTGHGTGWNRTWARTETSGKIAKNGEKTGENWWKLVKTGEHMVKTKENSGILDGIWPWFIYSSCISMDFEVLIYRFDMDLKWIYVNDIWIYQFVATFGKTGWRNKLWGQK